MADEEQKPVEYVVHIENTAPLSLTSSEGLDVLKDGFHDGKVWHPPHRIVRVERRD